MQIAGVVLWCDVACRCVSRPQVLVARVGERKTFDRDLCNFCGNNVLETLST